jgi:hypothetical protein
MKKEHYMSVHFVDDLFWNSFGFRHAANSISGTFACGVLLACTNVDRMALTIAEINQDTKLDRTR